MPLSDKEKMQIHDIVDKVVEARLLEFSQIQLTVISDMLLKVTDKYVESLMQLCGVLGLSGHAAAAARKEADRMTEMMNEALRR